MKSLSIKIGINICTLLFFMNPKPNALIGVGINPNMLRGVTLILLKDKYTSTSINIYRDFKCIIIEKPPINFGGSEKFVGRVSLHKTFQDRGAKK